MVHLPVIQPVTVVTTIDGPEACAKCKGACCKHIPGETLPYQWMDASGEIDWDRVEKAFVSGKWVLDWWEGDPRSEEDRPDYGDDDYVGSAPYIRPRHSTSKPGLYDDQFFAHGDCLFLTDTGCALPEKLEGYSSQAEYERPAGCTALVAKLVEKSGEFETECEYPEYPGKRSHKHLAATEWLPYADRLWKVASAAGGKMRDKERVA